MIIQHTNFGSKRVVRSGIHENSHNYGSHIHQFSEIVYVLEGSIASTVNGRTETVNAGDISVITPLKVHSTFTPKSSKIFICVFSNDFILDYIPSKELYGGYSQSVFTPSPILKSYLDTKLIPSAAAFNASDIHGCRTIQACIHALFEEYTAAVSPADSNVPNNVLAQILMYMNEHFNEPLTLSSVGAAIGYSAGYLSHCMETLPNMNFSSALNSFRIEHAKALLLSSKNYTNIDIALESGFSCERSFYRTFLKTVGMTPREYVSSKLMVSG